MSELEWPCRLAVIRAGGKFCPVCCSRFDTPEAQLHRRRVLAAARDDLGGAVFANLRYERLKETA